MERPKMSEVVKMLEGNGLAERWEEWLKEEMFQQEFVNIYHQNNDWIISQVNNLPDSTPNLHPEELYGPRWSFKWILFSAYKEVSWSPTLYSNVIYTICVYDFSSLAFFF